MRKYAKRIIGGLMLFILYGGLLTVNVYKYGAIETLILFGIAIVIVAFILIAVWLIVPD